MIERVLKNPRFNTIFSIVLGMALVFIAFPLCKGKECKAVDKAPSVKEMTSKAYRHGEKCYKYTSKTVKCPASGIIESFEMRRLAATLPQFNGFDA
jgi:hypothetical protein